ncbi:MAG TPA: ABC transporter ATP-binding protein [Acidimicrobiales bacterium]|jgi:branched-chain amino acid transport system ATP-binding protein|nr:ABC transporter ATP-binding protein [Acidimicrobiales bacterium]
MGLEVTDISVHFGGLAALSDVSLEAPDGSITGLIGPNGAGKTTLFNVIMGMQRPVGGTVRLSGRDLRGLSPHRRARLGLGRTFQRLELFGTLTVRENLAVAASMGQRRFSRTDTVHPQAVAESLLDHLGLASVAEVRADALPTGTGRLVELGRAMAVKPKVLLLDEPASGQDSEETTRFASVLRGLADDGLAVLLVEHDMELVMGVCRQVIVLDYGRVLFTGDPTAVQQDPDVQQAYLGSLSGATDG